eukprot:TRINITY_DN5441_c0_g1_i4.p1 TRINITY_DN5441_c0_g1~~TRINITY_DN5441_c0_g1_i4.p1  ORF type:complete len:235 (+),score=81.98 TRINITY_DN5441_c0_g1_i4:156-860(+)
MGGMCSSRTGGEGEAGTTYEGLCAAVESKLGLYNIEITDFESVLDEVSYKKDAIDFELLSDVFVRFGVTRDVFLAQHSIFREFYSGLVGTIEEDKGYVLSSSLHFCKGKIFDKKSVLWRCLMTTEKNYISYKELLDVIKMLVAVSAKYIPEIASSAESSVDPTMQMLLDATEPELDEYARQYFPRPPREGDKMHRYEFDEWLLRPESEGIFSSSHHRRSFVSYLNAKKSVKLAT